MVRYASLLFSDCASGLNVDVVEKRVRAVELVSLYPDLDKKSFHLNL
jgi:hypothetical protein